MLTRRNKQGSQHSLYYRRQFMLTAAYKRNTIKILISLKWIQKRNVPKTTVDFCINWPLSRGFFGSWGRTLVAVAVVERWPL